MKKTYQILNNNILHIFIHIMEQVPFFLFILSMTLSLWNTSGHITTSVSGGLLARLPIPVIMMATARYRTRMAVPTCNINHDECEYEYMRATHWDRQPMGNNNTILPSSSGLDWTVWQTYVPTSAPSVTRNFGENTTNSITKDVTLIMSPVVFTPRHATLSHY